MQNQIDKIIYSNISFEEKINNLKNLFCDFEKYLFVDFDDTITSNNCLLYSKYKFLNKYKKLETKDIFEKLKSNLKINQKFINILEKQNYDFLIILSRNNYELLKLFKNLLLEKGIKVNFIIGNTDNFKINSNHKIEIIGQNYIIGDIFEYKTLKSYKNFICIDNYSFIKFIGIYIKKIYLYLLFIIKNV